MARFILTLFTVVFLAGVARADETPPVAPDSTQEPPADSLAIDSIPEKPSPVIDTVLYRGNQELEPYLPVTSEENLELRLVQNPTVAMFKSMAIPGWGQYGNGRRIKAAVYLGLDVWMIASALHYRKKAGDLRDLYDNAENLRLRNDYHAMYKNRKDQRNQFTWYAVIVTFVAMFDAYVDAHLSGFPVAEAEGLSLRLEPGEDATPMAYLSLSF